MVTHVGRRGSKPAVASVGWSLTSERSAATHRTSPAPAKSGMHRATRWTFLRTDEGRSTSKNLLGMRIEWIRSGGCGQGRAVDPCWHAACNCSPPDAGAVKAVRPGVVPGGQDEHLPHAAVQRPADDVVQPLRPGVDEVGRARAPTAGVLGHAAVSKGRVASILGSTGHGLRSRPDPV